MTKLNSSINKIAGLLDDLSSSETLDLVSSEEVMSILNNCADKLLFDANIVPRVGNRKPTPQELSFLRRKLADKLQATVSEWITSWK